MPRPLGEIMSELRQQLNEAVDNSVSSHRVPIIDEFEGMSISSHVGGVLTAEAIEEAALRVVENHGRPDRAFVAWEPQIEGHYLINNIGNTAINTDIVPDNDSVNNLGDSLRYAFQHLRHLAVPDSTDMIRYGVFGDTGIVNKGLKKGRFKGIGY